ncbi:hypothetical protein pb186bvf_000709 [Paramecium bursaria]
MIILKSKIRQIQKKFQFLPGFLYLIITKKIFLLLKKKLLSLPKKNLKNSKKMFDNEQSLFQLVIRQQIQIDELKQKCYDLKVRLKKSKSQSTIPNVKIEMNHQNIDFDTISKQKDITPKVEIIEENHQNYQILKKQQNDPISVDDYDEKNFNRLKRMDKGIQEKKQKNYDGKNIRPKCEICRGRSFKNINNLQSHLSKFHGVEKRKIIKLNI